MVVRLLIDKINRSCSKIITPEELTKINLLKNATDLFYSSFNIGSFMLLHGSKIKKEIALQVNNFTDGIDTLMVISRKCIVQTAGGLTKEQEHAQDKSILLVVKAILMGIALGLIYSGIQGLITSGGAPHSIAISSIKLLIGSLILGKTLLYLKPTIIQQKV